MEQPQIPDTDWRNQEIKIDPFVWQLLGSALFIILAILIGFSFFPKEDQKSGYEINLYTSLIGFLVTGFLLDRNAQRRDNRRAEADLKSRLIREMGSTVPDVAKRAVEQLNDKRWLHDGSLRNQLLTAANLQETVLILADLQEDALLGANLQDSKLMNANMVKSNLWSANLQRAIMFATQLNGANMRCTNLEEASMQFASLEGTMLRDANLQNANIQDVSLSETTLLPDGTFWTSDTDLNRFTDPCHPHFWRSDDPASPAYAGKTGN